MEASSESIITYNFFVHSLYINFPILIGAILISDSPPVKPKPRRLKTVDMPDYQDKC